MSENVDAEEVRAILDAVAEEVAQRPSEVRARDFREPRRLSRQRLRQLAEEVGAALPDAAADLAGPLRARPRLTLASVSEVGIADLLDDLEAPFVVHGFRCGSDAAWLAWESAAAVAAVEAVLSGPPPRRPAADVEDEDPLPEPLPEARRLSPAERRVLGRLLDPLVERVARALELEPTAGHTAQDLAELETLRAQAKAAEAQAAPAAPGRRPGSDPRRLLVHLQLDGPGLPSDLRLYLPDPGPPAAGERSRGAEPAALPAHLGQVMLDVACYLGSVDVPLAELLALEPGDVIPLGVDADRPVELYVEDRACARGRWGQHRGRDAVRIEAVEAHPGEIDQPSESEPSREQR